MTLFDELSVIMGKVSLPDHSMLIQLYQEEKENQHGEGVYESEHISSFPAMSLSPNQPAGVSHNDNNNYYHYQSNHCSSSSSTTKTFSPIEILIQLWSQQFIRLSEYFPSSSINNYQPIAEYLNTEFDQRLSQLQKKLVVHATNEIVWGEFLHLVNEERSNEEVMDMFCEVVGNVLFSSGISSVG